MLYGRQCKPPRAAGAQHIVCLDKQFAPAAYVCSGGNQVKSVLT